MENEPFIKIPQIDKLNEKIENIENLLKDIIKKLDINIETEKKPVNMVELYGLKPLSFYDNLTLSDEINCN
jgi:hypothetical protein